MIGEARKRTHLHVGETWTVVVRSREEPPMSLLTRVKRLLGTSYVIHECRRCGTKLDGEFDTCSNCDSDDIARYDIG